MGELKMSRKKENVRCQRCGVWFNPKAYSGALIEGKTLCKACAKSKGWWVPMRRKIISWPKRDGGEKKESSKMIDGFQPDLTQPASIEA